jgi:hypothetical protein
MPGAFDSKARLYRNFEMEVSKAKQHFPLLFTAHFLKSTRVEADGTVISLMDYSSLFTRIGKRFCYTIGRERMFGRFGDHSKGRKVSQIATY